MRNKLNAKRGLALMSVAMLSLAITGAVHIADQNAVSADDEKQVAVTTSAELKTPKANVEVELNDDDTKRISDIEKTYVNALAKDYTITDESEIQLKGKSTVLNLPSNLLTVRTDNPDIAKTYEGIVLPKGGESYPMGLYVKEGQTLTVPKGTNFVIGKPTETIDFAMTIPALDLQGTLVIEDGAEVLVYGNYLNLGDDAEIETQGTGKVSYKTRMARNAVDDLEKTTEEVTQLPDIKAIPDQDWTGEAVEPKLDIKGATQGKDYDVTYTENIELGYATVTATAKGKKFSGSVRSGFAIVAPKLPKAEVSVVKVDGALKATATIDGMTEGKEFTVEERITDGVLAVIVSPLGNYSGGEVRYFNVDAVE